MQRINWSSHPGDPPDPPEVRVYSGNSHDRRKARRKAEYSRCPHGKFCHAESDGCGVCYREIMDAW